MRGIGKALLLTAAFVTLCTGSASAATIDFSTGGGGLGGTLTIGGGNVTGSGIFIDQIIVSTPLFPNAVFNVDGTGACLDLVGGCGLLAFDRNANTISIVGSIPALSVGLQTLLEGDLSGGVIVTLNTPTAGSIFASGLDSKARELLVALGLDPTTQFAHFGFVSGINGDGQGNYTAISTDITNTAVPEPGSLMLLGTGISAVAVSLRRRLGKKS